MSYRYNITVSFYLPTTEQYLHNNRLHNVSMGNSTPIHAHWIIEFDNDIKNNEKVQLYSQPLASYLETFWQIGNIDNNELIVGSQKSITLKNMTKTDNSYLSSSQTEYGNWNYINSRDIIIMYIHKIDIMSIGPTDGINKNETNGDKNVNIYAGVKSKGLNIFNFKQENPNDFNLITVPPSETTATLPMFESNYFIIKNNLSVTSSLQNRSELEKNTFTNRYNTFVNKNLILEDKFGPSKYVINQDLISNKNIDFQNKNNFIKFKKTMNLNDYQNTSLIVHQDFIVENNIETKKNIQIDNLFNTNYIKYNNVTISDTINVTNNFNTYANMNINILTVGKRLTTDNIIIKDSLIIKNNALYLPNISIYNDIEGSLRYNKKKHIVESLIFNKWTTLNTIKNNENLSNFTHHPYYKSNVGTNIDFIQNNNIILSINNNNKTIYINNKHTTLNNLHIKGNLDINNNFLETKNIRIEGNINIQDNFIIKDTEFLTILSNNIITNPINGSLRYNDKKNIFESYINKWRPLQQITNNLNTSNIDIYPKNNQHYDTILGNSSNSIFLNITRDLTQFNVNSINIKENMNIIDSLYIHNNLNTKTLNLNSNNIYKKNNFLVNDIQDSLGNPNLLSNDKLIISTNSTINVSKYIFYSSQITTTPLYCNIINPIVENTEFISKYSIFINKFKIYQTFTITDIILHLNKLPVSSNIITIKINNSHNIIFNIDSNKLSYMNTLNLDISAPNDLMIEIYSQSTIENIYAKIDIYGAYKNSTGNLLNNNSHIYIDQPNNFEIEDRKIIGNTSIDMNLNILNSYNINIPHLQLNKIGLGTSINNNDFEIEYNNSSIFIHKNNKIGIHTNNPTSLFTINSNLNIDKNINNKGTISIQGNLIGYNNLNIQNTLIKDNIENDNRFHINKNIIFQKNITSNYNINLSNNINISHLSIFPNLLFKQNSYNSNIIFNNNILYFNLNSTLQEFKNYPSNSINKIYLEDTQNIKFKYNQNPLLYITDNTISTNQETTDPNNILSISSNFNITKQNLNISSDKFIVNNIDLLQKIKDIERCYYSPYNINSTKLSGINNFNISYNKPQLYGNLNNYINHSIKYIDYIGFQFCLGNTNSNIHSNWNINSFIYYKKPTFNSTDILYQNSLNIDSIQKNNYIQSNLTYDFNNQIHTYNLNKSTDKTQLIYNTTDNCIFSSQITNQHLSLRMFPIYNTRDKELYYSTPINFKLD